MVRDHSSGRLAAVRSVYYRGGVNFKLRSPELTNVAHVALGSAGEAAS